MLILSSKNIANNKIKDNDFIGWAECVPYKRYNESLETVTKKIQSIEEKMD